MIRRYPFNECRTCNGSGGGDGYFRCPACGGTGHVVNKSLRREIDIAHADHLRDEAKDRRATEES